MVKDSWEQLEEDRKNLRNMIESYLVQYHEINPTKIKPGVETICKLHLGVKIDKMSQGTIILLVDKKGCPYCDVASLGHPEY